MTDKRQGTFLVIEGSDGSGKGTQCKLLADRLRNDGYDVAVFDFPRYDQPSGYFAGKYLNGDYGSTEEVGPYTASLFYALDRYDAAKDLHQALNDGKVVLANRYTASSMAHQGTKFASVEERRGFFIWLDNLEFEMLKIPRPDLNVILRVPAVIAQQLIGLKDKRSYTNKKHDIHEADLSHLERAVDVYDSLSQLFPKDFSQIDCVRDKSMLSIDAIHQLVVQKITPLLPEEPSTKPTPQPAKQEPVASKVETATVTKTSDGFNLHVPHELDNATKKEYCEQLDKLVESYKLIRRKLGEYAEKQSDDRITHLAQAVLPLASLDKSALYRQNGYDNKLEEMVTESLSKNYPDSANSEPASLTSVWPRNELELVADVAYRFTDIPYKQLQDLTTRWPYNQKSALLQAYRLVASQDDKLNAPALTSANFNWEATTSYGLLQHLYEQKLIGLPQMQALTPRHGFAVPKAIDKAGLTELFEDCFDSSLRLHSLLQRKGYGQVAYHVMLLGHTVRWHSAINGQSLFQLLQQQADYPGMRQLINHMRQQAGEAYPLLYGN